MGTTRVWSSRWRQLLVGGTSLALVAFLAAPAAGAVPGPEAQTNLNPLYVPPAAEVAEDPDPDVGKLVPTTPLRGEELAPAALSFTQLTPARPSGRGTVQMSLVPESADPDPMHGLVVVMKVAKGVQWAVPKVSGWKCTKAKRGTRLRCGRTVVASGATLSMDLGLKPARGLRVSAKKGRTVRITGVAKWRTYQGSKRKSWLETGSGTLQIQPRLGVKLEVAGDGDLAVVSNADQGARAVQLVGRLRNVEGQQVSLKWRQVRGPKVQFVTDRTVTTDERQVSQTVLLPRNITGDRQLVFELRATSGGQVVTDRARTRPSGPFSAVITTNPSSERKVDK